MKKLIILLMMLISGNALAQTFPVNNLTVAGTSSFAGASSFSSPVSVNSTLGVSGLSTLAGMGDTAGMSVTGPILFGSSAVQASCDNTGVTDATTCLNSAIQAAEAVPGGGFLIIPPGTYKISSTIFQSAASTISAYGVTFKWGGSTPGSCCTAMVKIGNSNATSYAQTLGFALKGLSLDANNTNNMYGFLWDTLRHGSFQDLLVQNTAGTVQGGVGPFAYFLTSNGTLSLNTSLCNFINLNAYNVWQGMAVSGNNSGGSATDNGFYGVHFFQVKAIGLDLIQFADTNYFYQTELFKNDNTGTFYGVVFNDGANSSTQANDIQEEQFDGLTVVAGGFGSTNIGLQINQVQDIKIRGYRFSSAGGTFSPIQVNGQANYVSYDIENLVPPLVRYYAAPAPTAVATAGAGGSPPAPVLQGGATPTAGTLCFGTGTSPSGGAVVNVTFASSLSFAPKVTLTPNNGVTFGGSFVAAGVTATGFSVYATGSVTASEPNNCNGYSVNYTVTP